MNSRTLRTRFDDLPHEILRIVVEFLPLRSIMVALRISRSTAALQNDEHLGRALYISRVQSHPSHFYFLPYVYHLGDDCHFQPTRPEGKLPPGVTSYWTAIRMFVFACPPHSVWNLNLTAMRRIPPWRDGERGSLIWEPLTDEERSVLIRLGTSSRCVGHSDRHEHQLSSVYIQVWMIGPGASGQTSVGRYFYDGEWEYDFRGSGKFRWCDNLDWRLDEDLVPGLCPMMKGLRNKWAVDVRFESLQCDSDDDYGLPWGLSYYNFDDSAGSCYLLCIDASDPSSLERLEKWIFEYFPGKKWTEYSEDRVPPHCNVILAVCMCRENAPRRVSESDILERWRTSLRSAFSHEGDCHLFEGTLWEHPILIEVSPSYDKTVQAAHLGNYHHLPPDRLLRGSIGRLFYFAAMRTVALIQRQMEDDAFWNRVRTKKGTNPGWVEESEESNVSSSQKRKRCLIS